MYAIRCIAILAWMLKYDETEIDFSDVQREPETNVGIIESP
jgi:hypothetical protein